MSRLLDFSRGQGCDAEGRFLQDLWAWGDDDLEESHNCIQWLFPLPEPTLFNPDAPLLTENDIAAFKEEEQLRTNLRQSFQRTLAFLGLSLTEGGKVGEGPTFWARVPDVWLLPNHNWRRVTRILRSLKLLGLEAEAVALYEWLETIYSSRRFPIAADTFQYWTEAMQGLPFHAQAERRS